MKQRWAGVVELQIVAFPQEGIAGRPGTDELLVEALRRGVDVIRACSYAEDDVERCCAHLRRVFDLAEHFDVPVDVHADVDTAESTDPRQALAGEIAALARARGWGPAHDDRARHHPRREGLDRLLDRATAGAAAVLGAPPHELVRGARADLVVLDAPGADHHTALLDRAPRRLVISGGRVVASTRTDTTLHVP